MRYHFWIHSQAEPKNSYYFITKSNYTITGLSGTLQALPVYFCESVDLWINFKKKVKYLLKVIQMPPNFRKPIFFHYIQLYSNYFKVLSFKKRQTSKKKSI